MKKTMLVMIMALALSACGNASTPTKSVENFMDALQKGEVQVAKQLTTKEMQDRGLAEKFAKIFAGETLKSHKAEEIRVVGDIAKVAYSLEDSKGNKGVFKFDLVRENGDWHVSYFDVEKQ